MSSNSKVIAVIGTRGFPGVQGGVEMHCQNIYTRLAAAVGVTARIYRRKPYLCADSMRQLPGIEYVDLPSTRVKGLEAVLHTLLCVLHIALHRPSVVHVHNIGPGMFAPLLKLMGLRVVMTYHSPNYEHDKWNSAAKRLLKWCEGVSLKWCDRVIFVNKFQMQKFSPAVQAKSVYLPNGINASATRSAATGFLEKHGIVPGHYLLGVGRLTPEKGFEHLVAAAQLMPEVTQVVIAGASDHGSDYAEKLRALDVQHKVVFTGFTSGEDLRQLYSHARLFVLSSVNEGFPLVLLEAMTYGLPVAVSDIPASHLIQLPNDRYFKPASPQSMAKTITHCLSTPAAANYDLAAYDWAAIARRTLTILLPQ